MGLGNCPVLPLGAGVRQADSQTLCLPRRRSDGNPSPPFLKPSALDNHRTVTLFAIMGTFQAQPVISHSAFACQKEIRFLLSAFGHSWHLSPPSALGRFTGRFWWFPAPKRRLILGNGIPALSFSESPANRHQRGAFCVGFP